MPKETPSKDILDGLQQLGALARVKRIGQPLRYEGEDGWFVHLELTLSDAVAVTNFIPRRSCWHVRIPESYPRGEVDIYPAEVHGVHATFPHQNPNQRSTGSLPWRTGRLCVDRVTARLNTSIVKASAETREDKLSWHVRRALSWLDAAASGKLLTVGEPFETPALPCINESKIVHDESQMSFKDWLRYFGTNKIGGWGHLEITSHPLPAIQFIRRFKGLNGDVIREVETAQTRMSPSGIEQVNETAANGFWWIWPKPIVIAPWQVPSTWAELKIAAGLQEVDFMSVFNHIMNSRANTESFLMLGYPIPERVGGTPVELYWQGALLPKRPRQTSVQKGFRDNAEGREKLYKSFLNDERNSISWILTESWHPERLQRRGRFSTSLRNKTVALIGVGSLGSAVAELLIRAGVREILLIDGDKLEAGNLVRHSLGATQLNEVKASAVAERLRDASPLARVRSVDKNFPLSRKESSELLLASDVVLDCTAENEVVNSLGQCYFFQPKRFLVASVGYRAQRLFLFSAAGCQFPAEQFFSEISPLLERERADWAEDGETLDGAGCWSPLFPARLDDIWLAAVVVVKHLERMVEETSIHQELVVYEQLDGENVGFVKTHLDGSSL